MALQLQNIRALVKANIGGRTDVDTEIDRYINLVLHDVARGHDWVDLQAETTLDCIASTKTYTLAADLDRLDTVRLSDYDSSTGVYSGSVYIPVVTPHRMDRIIPRIEQDSTGKPRYAVWWGRTLDLYRIPDDTYRVTYKYKQKITEMTTDASTCEIEEIDDVLVCGATTYVLLMLEEWESAAMWESRYVVKLSRSTLAESKKSATSPRLGRFVKADIPYRDVNNPFYQGSGP